MTNMETMAMDTVHLWALFGLATMLFGIWLSVKSRALVMHAVRERNYLRRQIHMLREAIMLYEYGARKEAFEMLDRMDDENLV